MDRFVATALLTSHAAADLVIGDMKVRQIGNMLGQGMGMHGVMDHSFGGTAQMNISLAGSNGGTGFGGENLEQTFTKYTSLPVGEAMLASHQWQKSHSCDPNLGYAWTQPGYPSKEKPLILFTTAGGQPSGVAVDIYGAPPKPQLQYAVKVEDASDNHYRINVAFRQGSILCSGAKDEDVTLGDVVIVNPGGAVSKQIPLTEDESAAEKWVRGSCFDGMGYHRFFDTSGNGQMTWQAANLFPVVAMYHEGVINAIFFASWWTQQGFMNANQWEPVPLINWAMCKNWCDNACTFSGTSQWSTMHIYFRDHNDVKCANDLKCFEKGVGCCPKDATLLV